MANRVASTVEVMARPCSSEGVSIGLAVTTTHHSLLPLSSVRSGMGDDDVEMSDVDMVMR